MAFEKQIEELEARRAKARAMGSPKRLAERKAAGILNARERVALLADDGSFRESGLLATSVQPDHKDKSPADGMVSGYARVGGRLVGVNASDFTTLGASSAMTLGKKQAKIKNDCFKNGLPLIQLMECAGGRIPDIMGAAGIGGSGERGEINRYSRIRTSPALAAVMGLTYGGGAFNCINSDFVVQRKGAVLAVSSQMVTSVALSEELDPEELGGWKHHTQTGLVDAVADTDEEAIEILKRFLSYMPDHAGQRPPLAPVPAGAEENIKNILNVVPESRAQTYDVRHAIEAIADPDSFFPLKERFAKVAVTGLARIGGEAVGIIASNPKFKGGALDADACDKITPFIVLCDSFNIPIIFLADTPGFLVGQESERKRLPGKIMNFMMALELATVPKIALILRKSFGQAYLNMGGGKSDHTATWMSGEISFMDPAVAVNIVYATREAADPERYKDLVREVAKDTTAYDLAAPYMAQEVIDPRETRQYIKDMLAVNCRNLTGGIGEHRLANWPPAF